MRNNHLPPRAWCIATALLLVSTVRAVPVPGEAIPGNETRFVPGKPITTQVNGTNPRQPRGIATRLSFRAQPRTDTTRHSRDNFRERVARRERETIDSGNTKREAMSDLRAWWEATRIQPVDPRLTPRRYLAVKTNLATWALTAINGAVEVQVGRNLTVDFPVAWCPWDVSREHAARFLLFQPEARHWFDQPGKGHFVGLHVHLGWFNVKWDHQRYQDTTRPLLGAGIAYGYTLPLGRHWGAEFSIGAGYANMKYHTYYNITNGARFDTRATNYWGITRVGINLVYNFNSK